MKNILAAAALLLAACGNQQTEQSPAEAQSPESAAIEEAAPIAPAAEATSPPPATLADGFAWPETKTRAKLVTSFGDVAVELYPDKAPETVANFLRYAANGHYDRVIFHRVVPGFVVQTGGYSRTFIERPTGNPIPYEGDNGLPNYRTTLAMARTPDPASATSQFYINLSDNHEELDHFVNDLGPRYGYAVFGRVIEGMEVIDAIGAVRTGPGGPFEAEVPVEPVMLIRVDLVE
ncbi:MAG: peptidylprolyl isomerase [Parvularculaceae bacterium]|nr:peptidylprolyl isomerase [Parvularculaceae bacterium]